MLISTHTYFCDMFSILQKAFLFFLFNQAFFRKCTAVDKSVETVDNSS